VIPYFRPADWIQLHGHIQHCGADRDIFKETQANICNGANAVHLEIDVKVLLSCNLTECFACNRRSLETTRNVNVNLQPNDVTHTERSALVTNENHAEILAAFQIDAAKNQWALEKGKTTGAVPKEEDIAPYLKGNALPACPGGGTYTINAVGMTPPTCSIEGHVLP